MEKFSKWRDPSTGIQPFLPLQPGPSTPVSLLLMPIGLVVGLARAVLLLALTLLYCALVTPLNATVRPIASIFNTILVRAALAVMGYYWIETETANAKRAKTGVSQSFPAAKNGDLIIANWTSYVDVLILAFQHNPTFLLPVFTEPVDIPMAGRSTGTGSASIHAPSATSTCAGYVALPLLAMLARTGRLPPTVGEVGDARIYPKIKDARRASAGPVVLFPEGTTSNGRAVLRFGEGVLAEDVGMSAGITWIKFIRHALPTPLLPPVPCPLPSPLGHLRAFLMTLPFPRSAAVRTLHPGAAPSSPSFLPGEILAAQPGGLRSANDATAWREACAIVLAETGRVRRVPGMGWAEKASFLDYYYKSRR